MTFLEIAEDLYDQSGRVSDLNPYDSGGVWAPTSNGAIRLTRAINIAMNKIATWKDRNGRIFRFKHNIQEVYLQTGVVDKIADSGSTVSVVVINDSPTNTTDYDGWILSVGDEKRVVVDTSGNSLSLHRALTTAPSASDEVTLYKPWLDFPDTSRDIDVVKVSDMEQGIDLEMAEKGDTFIDSWTQVGNPGQYYRVGNKIKLDYATSSARWFKVEIYSLPTQMLVTAETLSPDFPDQFHYAVVLYGLVWVYQRVQELNSLGISLSNFTNYMRSTVSEYDVEYERDNLSNATIDIHNTFTPERR
jgi:hypothetical protein